MTNIGQMRSEVCKVFSAVSARDQAALRLRRRRVAGKPWGGDLEGVIRTFYQVHAKNRIGPWSQGSWPLRMECKIALTKPSGIISNFNRINDPRLSILPVESKQSVRWSDAQIFAISHNTPHPGL